MNIFILDYDIYTNARYHCDKHVVKMPIEAASLLSTAISYRNIFVPDLYKPAFTNHPVSKWVRDSQENFRFTYKLGIALCNEYTYRYGKEHSSKKVLDACLEWSYFFPKKGLTPFVLAMPEKYKGENVVEAYRRYYREEKKEFAKWTKRYIPKWFK